MARTEPAVKIRIETPLGTPLGRLMNEIRSWLDGEKIQPMYFRPVVGAVGFGFEIGFRSEEDAKRFRVWFVPPVQSLAISQVRIDQRNSSVRSSDRRDPSAIRRS